MTSSFNEYVKPPQTAEWDTNATQVTGLHANHLSIFNADSIETVWECFVIFINKYIKKGTRGVLVAWNGNSCDFSWLYKLTQAPSLSFPPRICFTMDLYQNIKTLKSCKFHSYHSKLESLSLESVYEYVTKKRLSNEHSSIMDAKAQTTIVCHEYYKGIFLRKNSVKFISDIFGQKFKCSIQKSLESSRPVHGKWKSDNEAETWEIPDNYKYSTGSQGGVECGPT